MDVAGLLSVPAAAERLGVSEARVRALLRAGLLDGTRLGSRWLIAEASVSERGLAGPTLGRQLRAANAWAAIALASAGTPDWISSEDQRRVMGFLEERGVSGLTPRLRDRARAHDFYGHPGVLRDLAAVPGVALTGVSAARRNGLGVVAGDEIDAYVASDRLDAVVDRFALDPRDRDGNVRLRALPADLGFLADQPTAFAAVALDLAEGHDPRSAKAGADALERLDAERPWQRTAGPWARPAPPRPRWSTLSPRTARLGSSGIKRSRSGAGAHGDANAAAIRRRL